MTGPLVIDTNVVVAGLISGAGDSPVRRLLDGMLAGAFRFVLSPDLLAEYRRVLLRPAVRERHRLSASEVDVLLAEIVANALVRDPSGETAARAPDRGDDHLWQLLRVVPGLTLVTGDLRLVEQPPSHASVVLPRAAVALLGD